MAKWTKWNALLNDHIRRNNNARALINIHASNFILVLIQTL